jgi:glycosyltransferase involved in cell wall biosynthesis
MDLGSRVHVLGRVSTDELHRWYRTATAFVTLSKHEAFGMTLLEAAVGGAGVVASDIPAHREVAGYVPRDRVTLLSLDASGPDLADGIARAERRVVGPEELRVVPRWRDTVARTLASYEIALGRSA